MHILIAWLSARIKAVELRAPVQPATRLARYYHKTYREKNMKNAISFLTAGLLSLPCHADSPQVRRIDPDIGSVTWETQAHGVLFSLTQILPEQVQAFYVNRGFTLQQIEPYTSSCVYMIVVRNDTAPGTIHFITRNWYVFTEGKAHKLTSVESWIQTLSKDNIMKPALTAFHWAQFPAEQEYAPGGNWNQGMLSFGLEPGAQFDVTARWDIDGKAFEAKLQGVQCAR